MRGGPMEVTGGAQASDAASSSPPAANAPAPGSSTAYPDTGTMAGTPMAGSLDALPDTEGWPGLADASPSSAHRRHPHRSSAASDVPEGRAANAAPGANAAPASSPPASPAVHVMLTGSYPFEVSGDERRLVARTDASRAESCGAADAAVARAGYGLDRRIEVNAKPGETVRLSAPALGRLTVRTTFETCQIFLGGLALGYPPLAERPVASGTYRLTLRCPDGDQSDTNGHHPGGCHLHGADPMMGCERRGRTTPRAAVAVSIAALLLALATITLTGASAPRRSASAACSDRQRRGVRAASV